ncbi:protocadherin-like wing polarity protein stan isoform X3 [Neocloeon triangulifer]|nr:protocadherin-like wing polarity protein stan isoform X3 [Neocloeon triangulifer]
MRLSWLVVVAAGALLAAGGHAFLLLVPPDLPPGTQIVNSALPDLGPRRLYRLATERSAPFLPQLFRVDALTGRVYLKQPLDCSGIKYPHLFSLHIECVTLGHLGDVPKDYHSLAFRILVACPAALDEGQQGGGVAQAKRWVSETFASYSIPAWSDEELEREAAVRLQYQQQFDVEILVPGRPSGPICMKKSDPIASLTSLIPFTVQEHCEIRYVEVSDPRFAAEPQGGDLVVTSDLCLSEPLWEVRVLLALSCITTNTLSSTNKGVIQDCDHRLRIVFHKRGALLSLPASSTPISASDTSLTAAATMLAGRVRRELANRAPYFEQALYQASATEEKAPGLQVATLSAHDPEGAAVTYSMVSLLDSRSQGLFGIDSSSGMVSTKAKLDRESVDVHYFRVTAIDDSFPPRTGTTTLQVNVIDVNDHAPAFESSQYEATVRESVSVGSTVITLRATDQDTGRNAEIEYSLKSNSSDEEDMAFKIDPRSGIVSTRSHLDRETTEMYHLLVVATDMAPVAERKSSSATLLIKVLDDNDNYPQFTEKTYSVLVPEDINWSQNPIIGSVKAEDADQGANAALRYSIIGGNTQGQFSMDSLTGEVALVKALDYETTRQYRLVIRVQDGGRPSKTNTTQLLVNVQDVNDNAPRFYTSLFQESVPESIPVGTSVVRVQAYDADEGNNSAIVYTLGDREQGGGLSKDMPLAVQSDTGWVYTTRALDREEQARFQFQVIATDNGEPQRSATASVIISVQDVNDNDPVFDPRIYETSVAEDAPPGTPVATVTATDRDENPRLHYAISAGNVRGRFGITAQGGRGILTVAQPLDFKLEKKFILTVTASDSGGRHDEATVYINVTDANNFSPVFENAPYSANVFEDSPVGTTVLVVGATDGDVGQNAQITYYLGGAHGSEMPAGEISGHDEMAFSINPQTGAITTTKLLDREKTGSYLLTVTARDGGNPSLSDTTDVEIVVHDVNDNAPEFSQAQYKGSVPEDALVGTSVVQILATDVDHGINGRISYAFPPGGNGGGSFSVDPTSGVIRTAKMLDRESVANYELKALAIDKGSPPMTSTVAVHVKVEDVNDSPPVFESDRLVLYIPENSPIGSTVGEIRAKDADEGQNAEIHYSVVGGDDASAFSLVARPGSGVAELITMTELDYESTHKRYDLVIRAASPPLRNDVHVEVHVTDINDNAPQMKDFQVIFNNFRNCFPTGHIGKVPAFDADVTDKLSYRILSGNNANLIHLNESSGELTLSPQLNTNVPKIASMDISVSDGVNEVKANMQLTVRLISEEMLLNSITVRLNDMTEQTFLSPLLNYFIEGLAAIIPCPKENVYVFSIQDDTDVSTKILNVSISARRPDSNSEAFYSAQFLQERVYLNRAILARLATVQVMPFDDNLCVREPCLNFEQCLTVLKFGNASGFIHSNTVLFRPIYPVTTFSCQCAAGFTGSREHYLCDTEVNLCYSNPCVNGGTCMRKEGGYTCVCKSGFTGKNCEIDMNYDTCQPGICRSSSTCAPLIKGGFLCEHCTPGIEFNRLCELKTRSFPKGSFLTFPALRQRHRLNLKLKFATLGEDGLLLYNGRYNEKHDFIALEIINGALQFSFSLGLNVTTVSTRKYVSDGKWHTVEVRYFNKTALLSVDECDTSLALKYGSKLGEQWACANFSHHVLDNKCSVFTETCHRFLDLTGPLQIGGLPSLPTSFRIKNKDFIGCIAEIQIDHKFIDMNSYVADKDTKVGCPEKKPFCNSNPCKNGGKCKEGWGSFVCDCPEKWSGKDCSESSRLPWNFRGDGILSFNPLLRPIQLPWVNSLSIRTLQEEASLVSIQVGQNSTAMISISEGLIEYSYNSETVILHGKEVNDGQWHHVEVKWMMGEIWLGLDYGQHEVTMPIAAKIQGMYVGKIVIGGPESPIAMRPSYEGCIQDVRIGTGQAGLERPTVMENVDEGCGGAQDPCEPNRCPINSKCVSRWHEYTCECDIGFVGSACTPVCEINPCDNAAECRDDFMADKGYRCDCNSDEFSGEYCEVRIDQPCPASWWGYPVCGPCQCNTDKGYNSDCNKTTGQCYCKENHYQPKGSDECFDCGCYATGSYGRDCDMETGQCKCRNGVIGRRCDSCPNPYAEVTLRGCEVIYDGCPKSYASAIWWERTLFGKTAVEPCPHGSHGKASRSCSDDIGWSEPNLFNCTSEAFMDLRQVLGQLEMDDLQINTFVAVKVAFELHKATNQTNNLYGIDVLIAAQLLQHLIKYETTEKGLNLTHSQDKDYIRNIVVTTSTILEPQYERHWQRIEMQTSETAADLVTALDSYLTTLTSNQQDTYTNPFEIVSENMVIGLDVITSESLYGYESPNKNLPEVITASPLSKERVHLPDTTQFLAPPLEDTGDLIELDEVVDDDEEEPGSPPEIDTQHSSSGPIVVFPKYNNYLQTKEKFDPHSKIMVPLKLLGIEPISEGDHVTRESIADQRAVLSYAQFKNVGKLFPNRFDSSVTQRWGVELRVGAPVITVAALAPGNHKLKGHLNTPVRFRLWLQAKPLSPRLNPQCVSWQKHNGQGSWSRTGCHTSTPERWHETPTHPFLVNCTCNHLSTFTVLTDVVDTKYIPEPGLFEDIVTWLAFSLALPTLLCVLVGLSILRGGAQTNSNSIHRNLVICVFLAEVVFLVALKGRRFMAHNEFPCKLSAILLHYTWLSAFTWSVIDALHLYRMLTEMRDINHGPMRFYYTLGYGLPAVIVSLAVGVRVNEFGNYYFCWLSIYEVVVWSLIGPVCLLVVINLIVLLFAIKAAFTVKDHILDFGNLRTLLWLAVVSLPLLGLTWVLAVLAASEQEQVLFLLLSAAIILQAAFALLGYCVINEKVRRSLYCLVLRCMGKKAPIDMTDMADITVQSSLGGNSTVNVTRRSALAYHNASSRAFGNSMRRNLGISTSSTTSRSTCKTSSSPYSRSDTQLRNTSTSTSNYNSTSDVPSYMREFDPDVTLREEDEDRRNVRRRRGSESSENSATGPSLDLASSHSSDEDEAERRANADSQSEVVAVSNVSHYVPNITDPPVSAMPQQTINLTSMTSVGFNITTNSSPLFPDLKPMYAPRWSSQLPDAYITSNSRDRWSGGQGSTPTVSDNEDCLDERGGLAHRGLDIVPEMESPPDPPDLEKMVHSQENLNDLGSQTYSEKKLGFEEKYMFYSGNNGRNPREYLNMFTNKSNRPLGPSPMNDMNRPPSHADYYSPNPSPLPRIMRNPLANMPAILAPITAANISESE